jgi:hypothetical protein
VSPPPAAPAPSLQTHAARPAVAPHPHLAWRHRAAPSAAADKDFVERHGGIY